MLVTSTPETVNPVADACEAAKIPCLSTAVPWEAWYFGRGATPEKPFTYTYHFFIGVAEIHAAYVSLWTKGGVETNRRVGVMWPNDPDGKAIRQGLGPQLKKSGFTIVDPGAYEDGTNDYSAQIAAFKKADAEIFNTFPLPPDFATFWKQARQQGYRPRIASASPRPVSSPPRSRRSARSDTASAPASGGRPSSRTPPPSPTRPPGNWPTTTRSRRASSGTRSSGPTWRSSRSRSTR